MKYIINLVLVILLVGSHTAKAHSDTSISYHEKNGYIQKDLFIKQRELTKTNIPLPFPNANPNEVMEAVADSSVMYTGAVYKMNFYTLQYSSSNVGYKWNGKAWILSDTKRSAGSMFLSSIPLLLVIALFFVSLFFIRIKIEATFPAILTVFSMDTILCYLKSLWWPDDLGGTAIIVLAIIFMILKIRYFPTAIHKDNDKAWNDDVAFGMATLLLFVTQTIYVCIIFAHTRINDVVAYLHFSVCFWSLISGAILLRLLLAKELGIFARRKTKI